MKTHLNFLITLFLTAFAVRASALSDPEFKKLLGKRYGCLIVQDLKTGKVVAGFNTKRSEERRTPNSSFKIAAALMAFDSGARSARKSAALDGAD